MSSNSFIFGWGACDDGQLGIPIENLVATPVNKPLNIEGPRKKIIIKIACGYKHTLLLESKGLVYSSGSNEFGQLGHSKTSNKFHKVIGIEGSVREIAAGAFNNAAITKAGRVFMWGCNTNGQLGRSSDDSSVDLLDFSNGIIVQISLGIEHTIALTESSDVYVWGSNSQGQLGQGYCSSNITSQPTLVKFLFNAPIYQIAAGSNHNIAITPSGSVYAWGSNCRGQLGIGDVNQTPSVSSLAEPGDGMTKQSIPTLIKAVKRNRVVYASCGEAHTALLTQDGSVITFGSDRFGQLGHNKSTSSVTKPKRIVDLNNIVQLACGRRHTLVLRQQGTSSQLLSFGDGGEGQLGTGNLNNNVTPISVLGHQRPYSTWGRINSSLPSPKTSLQALVKMKCTFQNVFLKFFRPWTPNQSQSANVSLVRVFAGGDQCFAIGQKAGMDCPDPFDMRKWQRCNRGNIAVLSSALVQRYEFGLPDNSSMFPKSCITPLSSDDGDISESMYCLESYTPQEAFNRINVVFSSIGCLASSFLVDGPTRSHFNIGRADHGIDLDLAYHMQKQIFLRCPQPEARKLITSLMNLLYKTSRTYPDLECLRALIFLSISPLLETPQEDALPTLNSNFTEQVMHNISFKNDEPVDWYPVVLAGYKPGLVLGFFSMAINRLEGVPSSVIDSWFKAFRPRFFRRLVANLNNLISNLSNTLAKDQISIKMVTDGIHSALEFMKRLHAINEIKSEAVSYTSFYIRAINDSFKPVNFLNWLSQRYTTGKIVNRFTGVGAPPNFSIFDYPFIFDGACKAQMLALEAKASMSMAMNIPSTAVLFNYSQFEMATQSLPVLLFEVSRSNLIRDTITCLSIYSVIEMKRPLKVRFTGEEAVDDGGVMKEFFMLIMREILNPMFGMFKIYPDSRMLWFHETTIESPDMFRMVGALCGLAIYNSIIVDLSFPLALFKKLLDENPSMDDLKELDPVIANSLQQLLDYEKSDIDNVFALNFEVIVDYYGEIRHIPLISNGENIPITQTNKHLYVDKYIEYRFNTSCRESFNAFAVGFNNVCSGYALKMFRPNELQAMVVGSEDVNWMDLRRNANYQGEYWDRHQVIAWFWEVLLDECNLEEKKKFLRFLTGCDRVPIMGLSGIQITIQPTGGDDQFLPVAHTCYNILDLPKYSTKEILKVKFMQAIENTEGFGLV